MQKMQEKVPLEIAEATINLVGPYLGVKSISEFYQRLNNDQATVMDETEAEQYSKLSYWS